MMTAFLLAAAAALAQTPKFPIAKLEVSGNSRVSTQQVLAASGLKVGQQAAPPDFEAARQRLIDSGHFETVGFEYGPSTDGAGYRVKFEVGEIEQVFPVRFARIDKPEEALRSALAAADPLFQEQVPGTEPLLARYAAALTPLAGEKVVGRVVADSAGSLIILFQPARLPPVVAEVRFTGNEVLPETTLQNAVAGAAVGAVWDEKRIRQVLDANLRPLYEARGRIRVSFPEIQAEPAGDVAGMRLRVKVDEGEVYTLAGIEFAPDTDSQDELRSAANLKTGDTANFDDIQRGMERMRALVRANGYLKASPAVERRIDDQKKEVTLVVRFDLGPRYTFSKLNIRGLDILSEPAIRKLWTVQPGQPFNPNYPDYFLNRIREDGIFDNLGKTKSETRTDDENHTAEVTLYFSGEEPPPKKRFP